MSGRLSRLLVLVALASSAAARPAAGRSLAGELHHFIDTKGFPTFGEFVEVVTPIVQRLALRGIDFPVVATAPAFSYRFNFDLDAPERSSDSLGPVFVERADTVGRRRVDFAAAYLYADLDRFDGHDFGRQIVTAGVRGDPATDNAFGGAFVGRDFHLTSHVLSLSGTYGLTDRWDVNLLVPLVLSRLTLDGTAAAILVQAGRELHASERVALDASSAGLGDVLLRTKYRFADAASLKLAGSFTLHAPTGDENDFHGTGDTTLLPALVASRTFGMQDLHATLGVEVNADDLERSRVRYALGATLQPWQELAFLIDVLGSSSFVDDEFTIRAPAGRVFVTGPDTQLFGKDDLIRSIGRTSIVAFVPRSDVVSLAAGLRVSLTATATVFASAILPITSDGLRAAVMPTAGVEVSF